MLESQGESPAAESRRPDLRLRLVREPAVLALLSAVAVICFIAVSGLSRFYHAQQTSLGAYWFSRGAADLKARQYSRAVAEFRSALQYSRENYSYQLNLAEALVGQQRFEEASAYLVNLWDREPENGVVNLELARIAVRRGESDRALRFYNNAIYATWPNDQNAARQQTRLELINRLLKTGNKAQAKSEIIALAANMDDEPAMQTHIGDLFMQAQDYTDAYSAYRSGLKSQPHDAAALAGAGRAAFELGRYWQAHQYLQSAARAGAHDPEDASRQEIAGLVLRLDPFQPHIPTSERNRIVIECFREAGERLKSCAGPTGEMPPGLAASNTAWTQMGKSITERGLQRNPDLVASAMDLVFQIEREAAGCGTPTATDRALLLIAGLHANN